MHLCCFCHHHHHQLVVVVVVVVVAFSCSLKHCAMLVSFLGRGETESTWYAGHYLAYCTSPEQ
jgi:hypothetical protein